MFYGLFFHTTSIFCLVKTLLRFLLSVEHQQMTETNQQMTETRGEILRQVDETFAVSFGA